MNNEHYFTPQPTSESASREITTRLRGEEYRFVTEAGVFSRSRIDPGTRLLANSLPLPEQGKC